MFYSKHCPKLAIGSYTRKLVFQQNRGNNSQRKENRMPESYLHTPNIDCTGQQYILLSHERSLKLAPMSLTMTVLYVLETNIFLLSEQHIEPSWLMTLQ